MFGYPCELDELRAIAERHGLWIIDDSCEALGAEYKGRPIGSHGISGAFGFYPNKQITTGEGGVVTTHSEEEWELVKSLRNQGRSYDSRWFHHVRLGFNYRFTDIQAAVGIAQLEKLDRMLAMRSDVPRIATASCSRASTESSRRTPTTPTTSARGSSTSSRSPRASIATPSSSGSRAQGIEAGHYVPAVHLQPYMRERYGFAEGVCPVAEDACSTARSPSRSSRSSRPRRSGARRREPAGCDFLSG